MQPKDVCELLINEDEAHQIQKRPKLSRKAGFLAVFAALGIVFSLYSVFS